MCKKLTIYLAGPINGCSDDECNNWRDSFIKKMDGDYEFRNPMMRDYRDQYTAIHMAAEIVDLQRELWCME